MKTAVKILLLLFVYGAFYFIQPNTVIAQVSQTKTHVVEPRENLFSISRRYNITVQDIRDWNNLESDVVAPGSVLFVSKPSQKNTQAPTTESNDIPSETVESPIPVPPVIKEPIEHSKPELEEDNLSAIIHIVARGETLFSISRQYRQDLTNLRKWNNLQNDNLQFNQRLIVGYEVKDAAPEVVDSTLYNQEIAPADPAPAPPTTTVAEEEQLRVEEDLTSATFYTVRAGDTLSSISRRFGVSINDLRSWNSLRGDIISIGQELVVGRTAGTRVLTGLVDETTAQGRFLEYEIQRNDSIFRILLNHKMDETDFMALNSGLRPSDVRPGMKVMLLAPPAVNHPNPYRIHRSNNTQTNALGQQENTNSATTAATRYSDNERGQTTTSGDLYNPDHLTAAHQTLRLGTVVHVVNPSNSKSVFVLINDRITDGSIKLSGRAFDFLELDASNARVELNTSIQ